MLSTLTSRGVASDAAAMAAAALLLPTVGVPGMDDDANGDGDGPVFDALKSAANRRSTSWNSPYSSTPLPFSSHS